MKRLLLFSLFTIHYCLLPALTWSEPWQEDVIKNSDYFVLGKVINSERGSVKIKVIKNLGGKEIESEFTLQGFHMLSVCTKDNDEDAPTFYFHMIDTVYLFIKKSDIGYCIPTPTSGYAIVSAGKALSTFRHSYHQAHLPMATYEKVMGAIWNSYKGLSVDTKFVTEYTNKYLKQKPAGFRDHEINLFFNQHAALELVYHLKLSDKFLLISPFVNCPNNHLMISAVRCLGNMNTTESKKLLVDYIKDDTKDNFTRVIAVWSLKKLNPVELKAQLKTIYDTANETPTGFGGSKEDPRICTYIPNLKEALNTLLGQL